MPSQFDEAFAQVQPLLADFDANKGHYLSTAYQETEVRTDFINKLFIALGWDVNHDWQKNPFAQEVKVERGVHAGASQRRADYAFYVAPNFRDVRFFAEAKKPFGDIATADHYFQVIRYGWNAQTPVAVLTDFEQFQMVDCRYKPDIDTALNHQIRKFHFSEYADKEKFAEIFHLFSREAVASGSLEKFAETLPKKRGKAVQRGLFKGGYQSIDDAFLEELDEHRDTLARAFKNRNPKLDGETLTEITQRTLDRLVFLRFLEDKLIETKERVANFGDKGTAWQDFVAASRRLDGIYNGIVFKKHDLLDRPGFKVDDDAFADICERLCHVNTAYDFDKIPIHILGSIYERFLGKVIVTTDKRARVEEKPEVRKAGGVYYTPDYIVRYIVENTVGKLIAGKTPAQIAEMGFADIACGSGSFLLGVYDLLLRHHRDWFNANPDKAKKNGCVLREDGAWHLSLKQRREILLHNIYGVDIDRQAVEVAQLSLYLKLLEEETTGTAREYQMEFHETLLPSLNKNIMCGNSLIGTDILSGELFEPVEERKLNPMDFEDRFPEIMKRGGFDAIVGNPPWGAEFREIEKAYFRRLFDNVHVRTPESFNYFVYRMWHCTGKQGTVGAIIPSSFLNQHEFWKTRKLLVESSRIQRVCNLGDNVFHKVTAPTCILIFTAKKLADAPAYLDLRRKERAELPVGLRSEKNAQDGTTLGRDSENFVLQVRNGLPVIQRCSKWPKLKEVAEDVATGISSGLDAAFIHTSEQAKKLKLETELLKKLVVGEEISRYSLTPRSRKWIIYTTRETEIDNYPNILATLEVYRDKLKKRVETASGLIPWFTMYRPRRKKLFDLPKILIRQRNVRSVVENAVGGLAAEQTSSAVKKTNTQTHQTHEEKEHQSAGASQRQIV